MIFSGEDSACPGVASGEEIVWRSRENGHLVGDPTSTRADMYKITDRMAQQLVEFVSAETGYGMIVCDANGVIIGDSLRERFDVRHGGAAKIMSGAADNIAVTREEEIESGRKMREGYNCVIKVNGERLGTFGITGPIETVKPIAKIASAVISARIKESRNMDLIREVVTKVSVHLHQATDAIKEISAGSKELIATGDAVARAVLEADKKVKATNSILALILEVADQSKLLGLNAAILAAQAGVHGRGFSVVAEEIRKLAANSASSAKKVPIILAEIRSAMAEVSTNSGHTAAISTEQSRSLQDMTHVMEEILKSVNLLVDSVNR